MYNDSVQQHTQNIFKNELDKVRLDIFLLQQFSDYSRNFLQQMIQAGNVKVNQKTVSKTGTFLFSGDQVEVIIPEPKKRTTVFSKEEVDGLGITIIFQHHDFLIINKPAGVLVHRPHDKSDVLCLVDWLVHYFKEIKGVGMEDRYGIVHRLDKDTSGIMIVALNSQAHATISDLFRQRKIKKSYYAVVHGHPAKEGIINFPIGRHPVMRKKMSYQMDGRMSETYFKVERYFEKTALVKVLPVTGRTHQIRVHFSHQKYPLVGDVLYGGSVQFFKRQALHAYSLAFEYHNKEYYFEQVLPADMQDLINYFS